MIARFLYVSNRVAVSIFAGLLGACLCVAPLEAQNPAVSIDLLTVVPQPAKGNTKPPKQSPKLKALVIPAEVSIDPPFAWNRDDKYVPPDYESFFPDDPEGGKQLDDLFTGKLGGEHAPEDVLAAVRRGLRHSTVFSSHLIGQVGKFVWNAGNQDPRAIELLYHASDINGPVAHGAMYHGLCVLKKQTPNVMRTIAEGYASYSGDIRWRIDWGLKTYGQPGVNVELLRDLLHHPEGLSDGGVTSALELYRAAGGEPLESMDAINGRGRFVVAYTERHAHDENALRARLAQWVGDQSVESFVMRVAGGQDVGVGLIKGIGSRDHLIKQIEEDSDAALVFSETFAPNVLERRQLREFASFLPDGLPKYARPNYTPNDKDEKFTWNAPGEYQPPSFVTYFPDDKAGGLALDELYRQRDSTGLTARQQLETIRQGLRHSTVSHQSLCSWAQSIAGWPDDPMAKEIFYHAADPNASQQLRRNAIYFGLSGASSNPPNVLRLFAEIIQTEAYDNYLSREAADRIVWSLRTKDDRETVAKYLDEGLKNHQQFSAQKLANLSDLYRELAGKLPTHYDEFADRGLFFVAFQHPGLQAAELEKFAAETLSGQPYYVDSDVPTVGQTKQLRAIVIVRGLGGAEACKKRLSEADQVKVRMVGPIAKLRASGKMPEGLEKYAFDLEDVSYPRAFRELYERLGREYVHFALKEIDWKAVGEEFLPRSEAVQTQAEFCALAQELVARLEDSHAYLMKGTAEPEAIPIRMWDPGFACLFDDQDRPVVFHIDAGSPADKAGLRIGMTVTHLDDREIDRVIAEQMKTNKKYIGYSSEQFLRYQTARWLGRKLERDAPVKLAARDTGGTRHEFTMKASLGVRYLPRLAVPIDGIRDSANVSWKKMDGGIGYIYVRRIRGDLTDRLDSAVDELKDCKGLVIDVRGNSGGGFDASRALRNFDPEDKREPQRPRFAGPIAVLIDSRCISAGEGWVSWFRANDRAKFFGETTAGASGRKTTIDVLGGAYKVMFSVKAYRGFLDRPIERVGIAPDFPVKPKAVDIKRGIDTQLQAALRHLGDEGARSSTP